MMQRSDRCDGTSFYDYESKEHFTYKVQSSGAAMVSARGQSSASSTFSRTLRTQRMGLLQRLPEDALISQDIQKQKNLLSINVSSW